MADSVSASPASAPEPTQPPRHLWRWPIALGVLTLTGLLSALVSDGCGDNWSWVALGVPVAVMLRYGLPRRPSR